METVVEVDYQEAGSLALVGWASRRIKVGRPGARDLHTLEYHAMRKAKQVVLRRRTFLLPTMDASRT
jgi:hypothetical protein